MQPQPLIASHDAAELLHHYATKGCPVACGEDWTQTHIEAALQRGPHQSATSPDAVEAFNDELDAKLRNGFSKLVKYGDIRNNLPPRLKISPVAMIPHKSRSFRTILDLSFRLRLKGRKMPSVNSGTTKMAPAESMVQLGQCLNRIIAMLADNANKNQPFVFSKLDIKDGFWRMAVNEDEAWNFCYVRPTLNPPTNLDDIELVVPNCLQMGWCESPPFFCAATETARDVIDALLAETSLPAHSMEHKLLDQATFRLHAATSFSTLLEVFVDDFVAVTNNASREYLTHFSRAMLKGIHAIFPPPAITGHCGEDPISQKKLNEGEGTWDSHKEILGWLIDGANFTLQLPPQKCENIVHLIKKMCKRTTSSRQRFQELAGKLQHASFGVPGGKGLFSPIYTAMKGTRDTIPLTPQLKQALRDWRTFVQHLTKTPTPVQLLVPDYPHIIQYTDACGLGAGGVITPGLTACPYIVWQFEWPQDIKDSLVSASNPTGKLTINDLELAGLVMGWLVLEAACDNLRFAHIGTFCDNTSAVAWCHKGHTNKSIAAAQLLRFLFVRQRLRQTSSLIPVSIAGSANTMADIASRAFKHGEFFHAAHNLTSFFNNHFPLQHGSWTESNLPTNWASRVTSCLRTEPQQLESLTRLPKPIRNTGPSGVNIVIDVASTHTSTQSPPSSTPSSSTASQPASGPALTASAIRSEFKRSRMRLRPSARPLTWLANQVPSTKLRENTYFPSNVASKASAAKTLHRSHNLPFQSRSQKKALDEDGNPPTHTNKPLEISPSSDSTFSCAVENTPNPDSFAKTEGFSKPREPDNSKCRTSDSGRTANTSPDIPLSRSSSPPMQPPCASPTRKTDEWENSFIKSPQAPPER